MNNNWKEESNIRIGEGLEKLIAKEINNLVILKCNALKPTLTNINTTIEYTGEYQHCLHPDAPYTNVDEISPRI